MANLCTGFRHRWHLCIFTVLQLTSALLSCHLWLQEHEVLSMNCLYAKVRLPLTTSCIMPHQSDEGGERHAHTDHHPLRWSAGRTNFKVVFFKQLLHQSLLHFRGTWTTSRQSFFDNRLRKLANQWRAPTNGAFTQLRHGRTVELVQTD